MDINNNQQINTFTKGMNTDTSDAFIGADQYRYAENLRISTDTNSSGGALVPIDGTVLVSDKNGVCDWDNIIAMTSARDLLVVIGTKTVRGKVYMQVYEYNTSDEELLDLAPKTWRVMLVSNGDQNGMLIGDDSQVPSHVSTVVRWESNKNVKIYIADGVHKLMSIRLDRSTDVEQLESATDSLDTILEPPTAEICDDLEGNIRAAKVQYAYFFGISGNQVTALSPLSKQLVLYKDNTKGFGTEEEEGPSTGKSANVYIPQDSINTALANNSAIDFMRVYRISYLLTGHDPKIDLIYNGEVTSTVEDRGESWATTTMEELMSMEMSQVRPNEIESKGDFLFLANVSYARDGIDDMFKDIDATAPSTGGDEAFKTYKWNPEHWKNPEDPEHFGGQGEYFKWEYSFQDVELSYNNEILSGDDIVSLRRGEVYRYGVVLYDEHGQESSPKFIADIMIPPESQDGFQVVKSFNENSVTLRRIGIKFSVVKDLEQKGVYGWQIVRCNRTFKDKINLFQGICGLPLRLYKDWRTDTFKWWEVDSKWSTIHFESLTPQNRLYPGGFMSMQYYRDAWNSLGNAAYTDTNTLMFACPEFCYMKADTEVLLKYVNEKNLVFDTTQCYSIPTYTMHNAGRIYVKNAKDAVNGYTLASFRYIDTQTCFADSKLKEKRRPGDDQLWVDAYGPVGLNYTYGGTVTIEGLKDCVLTSYKDDGTTRNHLTALYNIVPKDFYIVKDTTTLPNESVQINKSVPVTVWNDQFMKFSDGDRFIYTEGENVFNIGVDSEFINWVAAGIDPTVYTKQGDIVGGIKQVLTTKYRDLQNEQHAQIMSNTYGLVRYAATGGKYLLFSAEDTSTGFGYFNSPNDDIFPIQIGNIRTNHPLPYGGNSQQSKLNSVYYANGNFVKGAQINAESDVFDGDTYLCMFTYNAAHCFIDAKYWNINKACIIYTVPIESSINLKARAGTLYPDLPYRDINRFVQDDPAKIDLYTESYIQDESAYIYNAAYDSLSSVKKYLPVFYNSVQSNVFDTRIHFTSAKEDNEQIDTWFSTNSDNFIDVDSRYGSITNMRLFKDKLIFWQERAIGLLTVNEKTIVQNNEGDGLMLALNQNVVKRYDYISTKYGMKKGQHTDTQSDNGLYWWDSDNKELLQYSSGLVPLTKAHLVENYINSKDESVTPCVSYCCDFDEIIANVRKSSGSDGESLVFNEKLNVFTGVYTFDPIYSTAIGNGLYLTKPKDYVGNAAEVYVMSPNKTETNTTLFGNAAYPLLQYIVNNQSTFVKTFDIQTFGGNFYGGGGHGERSTNQENVPELSKYPRVTLNGNDSSAMKPITLSYVTPLNQKASISGDNMSNREYDFRIDIPRNKNSQTWGDRLRGKTMQCEIKSSSNSKEFSLQYVITKYRMSWS